MTWDDVAKPVPAGPRLGEDLSALGIAELEARLAALAAESARVSAELERKRGLAQAAAAVFGGGGG